MISIHTNLSSFLAQRNLKSSTDLLNQAIERMTTGYKINGAKDNAANYAITTDINTKIGSYDVAEDNVAVGITMIETANSLLAEINDRFERLNALQIQASNGTYGENSRNAINAEVNSLIDEINRLYQTAEYNGIKLFMETVEDENGNSYYEQESYADETTTLADLEISNSSFAVYSKNGNLIQEYELTEDNTLGEFLDTLESEGFNTTMLNGEISISSRDGKYIIGDFVDSLGINTIEKNFVESTTQSYDENFTMVESNTNTITIYTTTTESTTQTETVWITTTNESTSTSTIIVTTTVETTKTNTIETTSTTYIAETETLYVEEQEPEITFMQSVTQQDTTALTALSAMDENTALTDGTYKISTTADLVQLANMTNAGLISYNDTFIMSNNIDLSTIENWTPIGNSTNRFTGTFDGNGFVVSNLKINRPEENYVGLFGYTFGDIINLGIENANVTGTNEVGIIAGQCGAGSMYGIENCYVTGSVTGNHNVGGVCGSLKNYIANTSCLVTVKGTDNVGGLVGNALSGIITNCNSSGDVSGTLNVGGFLGYASYTNISNSNSDTHIVGTNNVGGFIGEFFVDEFETVEIQSCNFTGTVEGETNTGGLIGLVDNDCRFYLNNSSNLSNSTNINGVLVGYYELHSDGEIGQITDCTYNSIYDSSGIPLYTGDTMTITNVTPVTVAETQVLSADSSETITAETTIEEWNIDNLLEQLSYVYFSDGTNFSFDITTTTFQELIDSINNANKGLTAELTDGIITITATEGITVDTTDKMGNIFNLIPLTEETSVTTTTTTSTQTVLEEQTSEKIETTTIYTTTTSSITETQTIYVTTTSSTTQTETTYTTNVIQASGATTFEDIGVQNELCITLYSEGTKVSIFVDKSTTFEEFYDLLSVNNITTSSNSGIINFTGNGDSYISSTNILDLLGLSNVTKNWGTKISNTDSSSLFAIEKIYGVYAPGKITLQVGTGSDENSQIKTDIAFKLTGINNLRNIGKDTTTDYLRIINDILTTISQKQAEFGAVQNRLESVLEEITIQRENLVSSRSTLRDADIAEVSSTYIQQQILQQASATLLSTANQTPAIALQLL